MKRIVASALAALGLGVGFAMVASPASAALLVDNWTLNVQGVDGLPGDPGDPPAGFLTNQYRVDDVDALGFNDAVAHAQLIDGNGNGVPNTGEFGTVEGKGIIGTILRDGTGDVAPAVYGETSIASAPGWELTFVFDVDIQYTNDTGNFTHVGPTNTPGTLSIYVDNLSNGGDADPSTGGSYTDGVLLATFVILPGEGGALNLATLDGSDDALFVATYLLPGVWFDDNGVDLSTLIADGIVLGFSDSNFDADPDDNGLIDGLPGGVTAGFACGTTLADFCAFEDGTFRLQEVPEPASLTLLGVGLLGLGALIHRRRVRH